MIILWIDDDSDIVEVITMLLEGDGFNVISSNNSSLLDQIDDYKPGIIFIDYLLDSENGGDICMSLKADPNFNVPVVLTSAIPNLEIVARECKADLYLPKPFDLDLLTGLIVKVLSSKSLSIE